MFFATNGFFYCKFNCNFQISNIKLGSLLLQISGTIQVSPAK